MRIACIGAGPAGLTSAPLRAVARKAVDWPAPYRSDKSPLEAILQRERAAGGPA